MPLNGTWNKAVTYNFYKNAVGMIKNNGAAGYTLKPWQKLSNLKVDSGDDALDAALKDEFTKLFSEAQSVTVDKGSYDAKYCFPENTVAYNQVKSATCTKKGNNYLVKVVFVDTKNPAEGGNNPITKCAPTYVDMVAMADAMKDGESITKSTGSATYTAYTITSEITPDGKFVSMVHSGPCKATLDMYAPGLGNIDIDYNVVFNAQYSGFKY
jgi:hypothetical protein